jgi:ADP-ribose pyrophosphatase YjhB (NUDIX family)
MISKFNIRVYGIWLKENKILVSNEKIVDFAMLKLPGGGLEFGEGTIECLVREFKEELNVEVSVKNLVHTTDSFIQSVFRKDEQVLAIHYLVESNEDIVSYATTQPTSRGGFNTHNFEWRILDENLVNEMTFEMDKQALCLLL